MNSWEGLAMFVAGALFGGTLLFLALYEIASP